MTRGKENAAVPGRATTATTDTEQPSKEPIVNQSTSVTTTTDRDWNGHNAATASSISPDAEAWLDAHPNFADEPVSAVIRAGFSARDLDGLFDRLKPAHGLAVLRRAAGMTVDDVAYLAGISSAYLAQIENGDTRPTSELVRHISAAIARDLSRAAVPTVATAAGFVVRPDSLLIRSLSNGDEARVGTTDRARYFVNVGA